MSKKGTILFFFATPGITGLFSKGLMDQAGILKAYEDDYDIVLLTYGISPAFISEIFQRCELNAKVITYHDILNEKVLHCNTTSWRAVSEEAVRTLIPEVNDIKQIVIFGGSVFPMVNRGNNKMNEMYDTTAMMQRSSVAMTMLGAFMCVYMGSEYHIPIHEVCFDPDENSVSQLDIVDLDVTTYHGYDIKEYGYVRLDSLQYHLMHTEPLFTDKIYDVMFGMTVTAQKRYAAWLRLNGFLSTRSHTRHMFVHNTKSTPPIYESVVRNRYMEYLAKSKYTVVIPAYNDQMFSSYRFIEAIFYDCLPLVCEDCRYEEFTQSYGIDNDVFKRIVVGYDDINKTIDTLSESDRKSLVEYFKSKVIVTDRMLRI